MSNWSDWYARNKEHRQAYDKSYRQRHQDKMKEYAKKRDSTYRKNHPLEIYARNHLNKAIITGRMERGSCEVCSEPNAEAHHYDYNKPFMVKWFCKKHHHELNEKQTTER